MVDKCSSTPKRLLETLDSMTTGCYEINLLLFANARGAGTLLTVKCPSPGTHRDTNAQGLPGGGARGWN